MPFAFAAVVIGAGLAAYQASERASAEKKQYAYQAKIASNNAKIAFWQRSSALQQGEIDAQNALTQKASLIGRQRAALSANGIDITQGSAQDILATTEFYSNADVASIQSNAVRQAWGYSVDEGNSRAQSNFQAYAASQISPGKQAAIAGAGSLLSSASSYGASRQ
jgi:hypothetical protein